MGIVAMYNSAKHKVDGFEGKEPTADIAKLLGREGFKQVELYSNIPENLIVDTLISSSERYRDAIDHILVPLHDCPSLLQKVIEKTLSPYALFVR